jgi:hypothetical protein
MKVVVVEVIIFLHFCLLQGESTTTTNNKGHAASIIIAHQIAGVSNCALLLFVAFFVNDFTAKDHMI